MGGLDLVGRGRSKRNTQRSETSAKRSSKNNNNSNNKNNNNKRYKIKIIIILKNKERRGVSLAEKVPRNTRYTRAAARTIEKISSFYLIIRQHWMTRIIYNIYTLCVLYVLII